MDLQASEERGLGKTLRTAAVVGAGLSLFLGIAGGFHPLSVGAASGGKNSKTVRSATGLDRSTLNLINRGQWKDAKDRLEQVVQTRSVPTAEHAWLAFAYLFLNNCASLDSLSAKVPLAGSTSAVAASSTAAATQSSSTSSSASATTSATAASGQATGAAKPPQPQAFPNNSPSSNATAKKDAASESNVAGGAASPAPNIVPPKTSAELYALLVQIYAAACHGKYEAADAMISAIPEQFKEDATVNFTLAAVAGKEGKAAAAAEYCQQSVKTAPDFAWGLRTLGYLQQRWLKAPDQADQSYQEALKVEPDFPEVRDALVELKEAKNDYDGAVDVALNAIKRSPHDANNYYRLAQIYTQQWRHREALQQLEKAISLDPTVARFFRSRATIKKFQGDLNDAIADQQRAIELSKDKPFDLVELAAMNIAAGNFNRAADNLQAALKADPSNQAAHDKLIALLTQEKRYDDLVLEFQRLLAKTPKDVSLKLGLAKALVDAGKIEEATKQYTEAANMDPNNAEPHRQMGALRFAQKDYSAAQREYTRALNINPSSVPDLVALGCAYAQDDEYKQAEAAFITALALQQLTQPASAATAPDRLQLMNSLATLLLDEGRYGEAAAQFETLLAATHSPMDGFQLGRARALRDLSHDAAQALMAAFGKLSSDQQEQQRLVLIDTLIEAGKLDLASPLLKEALSKAPARDKGALLLERGKALLAAGDLAGGEESTNKALDSTDLSARQKSIGQLLLSKILFSKGDLAGAEAHAQKSLVEYPKNFSALLQIGRICLKRSDAKSALDAAKKTMDANQYATKAYLLQGDAQMALGEAKNASASYHKAAELYPALLEAHKALLEALRKLALKDEVKQEEEQIVRLEKVQ